jgi:multiple sugar transport system permease protein
MSEQEIENSYSMVTSSSGEQESVLSGKYANVKLIPDMVTLTQYYTALIKRTQFLIKFWNSLIIVVPIILGQILVSSMAAYAFAKLEFIFRDKLFFTYIIIMMMPFQVTLVPNYIMASELGLVGSYWSIILPGIFGTFGVFLMRQFMMYIPDAYVESAKVDGASQLRIFFSIILPMSKTGLAALAILVFIDNWNMVEQPLIFLQDINMHPLSTYLSSINSGEMGIAFAASTIYMLPMLLIFLYGENYLVQGIQLSGLKG